MYHNKTTISRTGVSTLKQSKANHNERKPVSRILCFVISEWVMADQKPQIFELNNGTMQVKITNLGCTITSLSLPDKNGNQFLWMIDRSNLFAFCCFLRCCWLLGSLDFCRKSGGCGSWIRLCWAIFGNSSHLFLLSSVVIQCKVWFFLVFIYDLKGIFQHSIRIFLIVHDRNLVFWNYYRSCQLCLQFIT